MSVSRPARLIWHADPMLTVYLQSTSPGRGDQYRQSKWMRNGGGRCRRTLHTIAQSTDADREGGLKGDWTALPCGRSARAARAYPEKGKLDDRPPLFLRRFIKWIRRARAMAGGDPPRSARPRVLYIQLPPSPEVSFDFALHAIGSTHYNHISRSLQ